MVKDVPSSSSFIILLEIKHLATLLRYTSRNFNGRTQNLMIFLTVLAKPTKEISMQKYGAKNF